MRPFVMAGLVLVVIVAGTLGLVGINQNNSEQQRQAAQYQHAVAYETAAVATSDTIGATMIARQQADTTTLQTTIGAEATRSVGTLAAYRSGLEASATAGQVGARDDGARGSET